MKREVPWTLDGDEAIVRREKNGLVHQKIAWSEVKQVRFRLEEGMRVEFENGDLLDLPPDHPQFASIARLAVQKLSGHDVGESLPTQWSRTFGSSRETVAFAAFPVGVFTSFSWMMAFLNANLARILARILGAEQAPAFGILLAFFAAYVFVGLFFKSRVEVFRGYIRIHHRLRAKEFGFEEIVAVRPKPLGLLEIQIGEKRYLTSDNESLRQTLIGRWKGEPLDREVAPGLMNPGF